MIGYGSSRARRNILPLLLGAALACTGANPAPGESEAGSSSAAEKTESPTFRDQTQGALPGAAPFGEELLRKMKTALAAKGPDYVPRTHHLNPDGSAKFTNRLILETSPYLIQHAHNPVNWFSWGDEAFRTARDLGRPVLLSVGYSTCHWCHVMEEESFDDEEIAKVMNENYIAIKVDREERPDVDAIYMSAVQSLTGRGGWPMTVWLTPEREPFYGGTYFPARDGDRGSRVGFLTLLHRLKKTYDEDPGRITSSTSRITQEVLRQMTPSAGTEMATSTALKSAMEIYRASFDSQLGGLRRAPKFPSSLSVRFLLRYHRRTGDAQALEMATLTLEKMAAGGIHDQAGGGFHRYSTDAKWLVPHFEKMLYDNALLTLAYLEGYQATGREDFAEVARRILRYIERDMTAPGGAFYSATDADSLTPEGRREEGWFFTWTPAEILQTVGAGRAPAVLAYYQVTEKGNFENRNILHTPRSLEDVAGQLKKPAAEVRKVLDESRELLYQARKSRPLPLRDEKILTAWNGLMISALARASLVLDEESYARRAERAAEFILENLRVEGRLLRSYQSGQARHDGFLSDHAFLAGALLDLYEATGRVRWLREAVALDQQLAQHFEDTKPGGFFRTRNDHEHLLAREKPDQDGAEPSGNSLAILNLLRLHEFTTQDSYRQRAVKALVAFQPVLASAPTSLSEMLLALDFHLDLPKEIVIVTPRSRGEAAPMMKELRRTYLPNHVLVVASEGGDLDEQGRSVPLLEGKIARGGKTTAYVCEKRVCKAPTTDPAVFAEQIRTVSPLPEGTNPG